MPFEGAWVPGNVLTRLPVDEVLWGRMKIEVRVFWVLLLTAVEIFGQSDLASITGTVRDSSGAVVCGGAGYRDQCKRRTPGQRGYECHRGLYRVESARWTVQLRLLHGGVQEVRTLRYQPCHQSSG